MDFLKKAAQQYQESTGSNSNNNANNTNYDAAAAQNQGNTGAGADQSEDYGDKALDFIEKKAGHTLNREQNEKITDGARGAFEKFTGKHLDSKWSN